MHIPVLLSSVLEYAAPSENDHILDCTFGRGGYSRAFLEKGCHVTALDRDETAKEYANTLKQEFGDKFTFIQSKFSQITDLFQATQFNVIVFDIGVSSPQLDVAERGFSFMKKGPLDMRMGSSELTAADIINTYPEEKLADLIFNYGEEKRSRKIARQICTYRKTKLFETTTELAELIASHTPNVYRKHHKIHPATLTFQALRIAVNDELREFETALTACHHLLKPQGRLVTVTFHSLEDRIAKTYFKENSFVPKQSKYAKETPKADNLYALLTKKPMTATALEIQENPRASSAKLRAVVRSDFIK